MSPPLKLPPPLMLPELYWPMEKLTQGPIFTTEPMREIEPELEVAEFPAADVERPGRISGDADAHLLVAGAQPDPRVDRRIAQRMPVDLPTETERAGGAVEPGATGSGIGGAGEPVREVSAEEDHSRDPDADVDLDGDGERREVAQRARVLREVDPAGARSRRGVSASNCGPGSGRFGRSCRGRCRRPAAPAPAAAAPSAPPAAAPRHRRSDRLRPRPAGDLHRAGHGPATGRCRRAPPAPRSTEIPAPPSLAPRGRRLAVGSTEVTTMYASGSAPSECTP